MDPDQETPSALQMATDIVSRSQKLLHEMEDLRNQLFAQKDRNAHIDGLRGLIDNTRAEISAAESYLKSTQHGPEGGPSSDIAMRGPQSAAARFRSSNISAIEMHWSIVKRCHHLVSVHKQVHKPTKTNFYASMLTKDRPRNAIGPVCVHAVVEGGAEWIRIVTKDQNRLFHEMAESGWDWELDQAQDSQEADDKALLEDLVTLRQIKQMVDVARATWHNYCHPRIRVIFTRVKQGQDEQIDMLLDKIRELGVRSKVNINIHCAESVWVTNEPPVDTATAISNLLPRPQKLSDTVLLDTSVLIALASDVCHAHVETKPWMSDDLRSHIEEEQKGTRFIPYLVNTVLQGKQLICTKPVVDQFMKITRTMGTPTEKARSHILVDGGGSNDLERLSIHPMSHNLILPLRIIDTETGEWPAKALVRERVLPGVALRVEKELDNVPSNRSTHLYAWASRLTVVTCNRALTNKIVRTVEASLTEDYLDGPRICALPYNRALLTKGPSPARLRRASWLLTRAHEEP